jgi:hypothetical protein
MHITCGWEGSVCLPPAMKREAVKIAQVFHILKDLRKGYITLMFLKVPGHVGQRWAFPS